MKKLFLIFSHNLTEQQFFDAKNRFGVTEFISLPFQLQKIWSQILADGDLPIQNLNKIVEFLQNSSVKGDYVLVQGEFGATFYIVDYCFKNSLIPIYSTSKRNTVEKMAENGKIEKISYFQHVNFRKYVRYE